MDLSEHTLRWCVAFAITQAVECPLYRRLFGVPLWAAFVASALTHPVVVWVMPHVWDGIYVRLSFDLSPNVYFLGYGVLAETFAIVAEAVWLRRWLPPRRALVASLVANLTSCTAGGLCWLVTGWP